MFTFYTPSQLLWSLGFICLIHVWNTDVNLCVCPCVQTKSRGREDDDDDEGEQEEGEDDGDSANGDESWMWNTHTHISPHQTCTQWLCLLNWLDSYLHHMVAITPLMHKFTDMRSTCFRIFFQVGKVNSAELNCNVLCVWTICHNGLKNWLKNRVPYQLLAS